MDGNPHETNTVRQRVAELGEMIGKLGLQYSPLPEHSVGAGHAIAFREDVACVASCSMYLGDQFSITWGINRDVDQDRLKVLDACNRHNQDHPAYPMQLHDAIASWDTLLVLVFPLQLFRAEPDFIQAWQLNPGFCDFVDQARETLNEAGVGGTPYQWNPDDMNRLLSRSLI